jgi:hypothetical protein
MTTAYPLHWPAGMPRTKTATSSKFKTSLPGALGNLQGELRRFGNDTGRQVKDVVLSSNVTLTSQRPQDPGIACYFTWDGIECCIAVDRYAKVEDNVQAIALIIEAERTKMRHGGLNIVRAGFRGYAALPPPKDPSGQLAAPWRQVLFGDPDIRVTRAEVDDRYKQLVKLKHPDRGGNASEFNAIVEATRQAREELPNG